jgi:uroporphyrinogen decarboxylase
MEHRARINAAINHQPVDQLPCAELVITDEIIRDLCGQQAVEFAHRLEFVQTMGLDAVCLHPCPVSQPEESLHKRDLAFADLSQWVDSGLFTFAVLDGPVGWSSKLLGFEEMMLGLMRKNGEFAEVVTAVEKLNIALMEQLAANGVNGILLADDIAFNQGVIARPALLRKNLFPSLARQVEYAKRLGLPVFFHSDGNLMTVLDDIVAAGFDGLQCIEQLAGMDLGAIKARYGHKLCLWGNLDPAELLGDRSPAELEGSVRQIVTAGAAGSGLIFGTSSGLFERMNLENIKTVYSAARGMTV